MTTNDLGTIVRGLNFNPTEREVAEMQKDVDPQQTGSFDQNSLISLIARRPKQNDTLEDMIESLKILSQDTQAAADGDQKTKQLTLIVDNFKNQMTTQGKENGENLLDHYVEEIITDSKLVHEDSIIIDDFAKYLMSKWLIMIS